MLSTTPAITTPQNARISNIVPKCHEPESPQIGCTDHHLRSNGRNLEHVEASGVLPELHVHWTVHTLDEVDARPATVSSA